MRNRLPRELKFGVFLWSLLGIIFFGSDGLSVYTHAESDADSSPSALVEDTPSDGTFNAKRAFAYLEKQCEFGPRVPGTTVHEETAAYLFAELEKYADEVVFQPFEFRDQDRVIQMNNILARFGEDSSGKMLLAAHWDTRHSRIGIQIQRTGTRQSSAQTTVLQAWQFCWRSHGF